MEDAPAGDFGWLLEPLPSEPEPRRGRSRNWRLPSLLLFVAAAVFAVWQILAHDVPVATWLPWGCAATGLWAAVTFPGGLVDRLRVALFHRARRRHPGEPWMWDHAWDPAGVSVTAWSRMLREPLGPWRVTNTIVLAWFAAKYWPVSLVIGIYATIWAWQAWRIHGLGTARVSFSKFPFAPGDRVTLYLGMSEGGATFTRAAFLLRRVEEYPSGAFGWERTASVVTETCEHRPPGLLPGPGQDVELVFDIPADAPGTCLSAPFPRYWTLDVVANTSAGPYVESFLIPVYEPAAAAP